jgi:hypothetical protein
MKGVRGCANLSKLKQPLPEVQSRLFENRKTISFFIFHSSFLICIVFVLLHKKKAAFRFEAALFYDAI